MTPIGSSVSVDKEQLFTALSRIFPGLSQYETGLFLSEQLQLFEDRVIDGVTVGEINEINARLASAVTRGGGGIIWPNGAEFVVSSLNDDRSFDRFFDDRSIEGQGEHALTYRISKPSKEFTAFLLCSLSDDEAVRTSSRWALIRHRARMIRNGRGPRRVLEELRDGSLLDLVGDLLGISTLRVESPKVRSDFEVLANSFLFHVAYNMDIAARLGNVADLFFRGSRIQRVRRVNPDVFDAPRQTYNTDLVHHYLVGVAAEIPLLQYLSYYHIAEHYFEKVFNDDLVEQVQKAITDPSFSVRRAKDVQGIVKVVNKAQRQVKEEGGVNELRALQLVIEKFVDLGRLADDLDAYDGTLVQHYKQYGVPFAEAGKVDLRLPDVDDAKVALAKRIYKIRNALVHAKEGTLPRYAPFAHDEELAKEIPLIRFAAEQVIIAHGRIT